MASEGDPRDLRKRTNHLARGIARVCGDLPKTTEAQVRGRQLLRCGTSVGAHYREGMRARSPAEFISKLEGGLQELEETAYWLELMQEAPVSGGPRLRDLRREVDELIAMFVASVRTTKSRSHR